MVEYARNVCGLKEASSTECDPDSPHRLIVKLRELVGVDELGGTMRLGAYPCVLEPGSLAQQVVRVLEISERHRHRYEFNHEYDEILTRARAEHLRSYTRTKVRGDCGDSRPSMVPGRSVSSRVQVTPAGAPSIVPGLHRRRVEVETGPG